MNGKRPGGWVALAWRYFRDPRFDDVSADAELLWCHALAYCGEQETDGHVARGALVGLSHRLSGPPSHAAAELVAAGLWSANGRGYSFPKWQRWQPTAEQAERSRVREADRKRSRRAESRGESGWESAVSPTGSPGGSPRGTGAGAGAGAGHSPTAPDPTPVRENQEPDEDPARLGWEEYTDAAGNLFVRHATNGQAADLEGGP